jgi:hypothetical protein
MFDALAEEEKDVLNGQYKKGGTEEEITETKEKEETEEPEPAVSLVKV